MASWGPRTSSGTPRPAADASGVNKYPLGSPRKFECARVLFVCVLFVRSVVCLFICVFARLLACSLARLLACLLLLFFFLGFCYYDNELSLA